MDIETDSGRAAEALFADFDVAIGISRERFLKRAA